MNKTIGMIAAPAVAMTLADAALLAGVLLSLAASPAFATDLPNKGTTPYVTHFVFRPLMNVDVPGVGSVTTGWHGVAACQPFSSGNGRCVIRV
jgi:hypothetical protein